MKADVLVIGGGMAGLGAASELARRGLNVMLLEARDRLGGRVFSVAPRGWPGPVELGAEFVHGGNAAIRAVAKRARLRLRPVSFCMRWREADGTLRFVPDFWPRMARIAEKIPARDRGWSFAEFLRRIQDDIPAEDRAMAGHYVGGFNAGPLREIGAHALRANRAGADDVDYKIAGRYDGLVRELERQCSAAGVVLRLKAEVAAIRWRRGNVIADVRSAGRGTTVRYEAKAAVITLPLGVLRAKRVRFTPVLRAKQKIIARLGWGHAQRVTVRFRRGFWSAPFMPTDCGAGQGRAFGAVNAPGEPLPVWWALTAPEPVLTGWAGGNAARGAVRPSRAVAKRSLARIFSTTQKEIGSWIVDVQAHDWSRDPLALGAYSFARAGNEGGPEKLAEPVAGTLFFAGEATAEDLGTVHGALDSGLCAARRLGSRLKPGT